MATALPPAGKPTAADAAINEQYKLDAGVVAELPTKHDRYNYLPGVGPISALMLTAVLSVWLAIAGPISTDIQSWQTLIGVCVAVIAAWIAWSNVKKQVEMQRTVATMNLLSREEDRMENALPGLRDANTFLQEIRASSYAVRKLEPPRVTDEKSLMEVLGSELPLTDPILRQRIAMAVTRKNRLAERLEFIESDPPVPTSAGVRQPRETADRAFQNLQDSEWELRQLQQETASKIKTYEARLPIFRAKLEAFFAGL